MSTEITPEGMMFCGVTEQATAGSLNRWRSKDITYCVTGFIPQFTEKEYRDIVRGSFDAWEAVCGIRANEVMSSNANVIINVGRGRRMRFDGPGRTLAWCEIPNENTAQVLLRMDLDENWTLSGAGIFVPNVLRHELGHGLGIFHIEGPKALMNPFYDPKVPNPLGPDIEQAVLRYAAPRPRVVPVPPPVVPTPTPTPGNRRVVWQGFSDGTWEPYVG